ncbi:hypothetical protein DIPPA_33098 [Diplonema papillatum]|nr:hypothetical protein DIPPA_33098 [Diplonema papillatum]
MYRLMRLPCSSAAFAQRRTVAHTWKQRVAFDDPVVRTCLPISAKCREDRLSVGRRSLVVVRPAAAALPAAPAYPSPKDLHEKWPPPGRRAARRPPQPAQRPLAGVSEAQIAAWVTAKGPTGIVAPYSHHAGVACTQLSVAGPTIAVCTVFPRNVIIQPLVELAATDEEKVEMILGSPSIRHGVSITWPKEAADIRKQGKGDRSIRRAGLVSAVRLMRELLSTEAETRVGLVVDGPTEAQRVEGRRLIFCGLDAHIAEPASPSAHIAVEVARALAAHVQRRVLSSLASRYPDYDLLSVAASPHDPSRQHLFALALLGLIPGVHDAGHPFFSLAQKTGWQYKPHSDPVPAVEPLVQRVNRLDFPPDLPPARSPAPPGGVKPEGHRDSGSITVATSPASGQPRAELAAGAVTARDPPLVATIDHILEAYLPPDDGAARPPPTGPRQPAAEDVLPKDLIEEADGILHARDRKKRGTTRRAKKPKRRTTMESFEQE